MSKPKWTNNIFLIAMLLSLAILPACSEKQEAIYGWQQDTYPSTYQVDESLPDMLIRHATVLTGTGEKLVNGAVLIQKGKIAEVGVNIEYNRDDAALVIVDAKGKWLTPGIIDVHSHLGVYPAPAVKSSSDGNEATNPVTAEVWAEHSVWPQDPQFRLALQGGVTSLQILPGSANLMGGRSVTLKNVHARNVQAMKFPDAPYGLKMACGENPKRVYGERFKRAPSTRMGNVAGYRAAWIEASAYKKKWEKHFSGKKNGGGGEEPKRDLRLETLAGVLSGDILVHNHCYRADEMAVMIDIAKEFDYKITAFHHAIESYKVADILAKENICSAMWADWWGFKQEAYDFVRENISMVDAANACAIVHSDSALGIQRLNQEAAKAMAAGNKAGLKVSDAHAMRWLTLNAAKALGIDTQTGSIEKGKMADLVLWSGNPFSVYTKTEKVLIDGALVYDRHDPAFQPMSDFDLGILAPTEERP